MTNQPIPGASAPNKQSRISLFNLAKRTGTGVKIICRDLTFDQITGLAPEIPAAIVKFSRMEAKQ